MITRFVLAVLASLLLLTTVVPMADASSGRHWDARNTNATPLDLHWTSLYNDSRTLTVNLKTYSSFTDNVLKHGYFVVNFSKKGMKGFYMAVVWKSIYGVKVNVRRVVKGTNYRVGSGHVTERSGNSLTLRLRRNLVEAGGPGWLKWNAHSYYSSTRLCAKGCVDWTPRSAFFYINL